METINSDGKVLPKTLVPLPERVLPHDSLAAAKTVCHLLGQGVAGIFGPRAGPTSPIVQSICDTMDIPNVVTTWDTTQCCQDHLVNLYPHPSTLARVYMELLSTLGWTKFTILYEDGSSLLRLSALLKMSGKKNKPVTVRQLDPRRNHRQVLRDMKMAGEHNILLDCSIQILPEVLKQAQQVGLMTDVQNYIITTLDLHTIDLEPYQYGGTNITGLRMVDPKNDIVQKAVKGWEYLEHKKDRNLSISADKITVSMALIHDAVRLFAHGLSRLNYSNSIDIKPLDCEKKMNWQHGASLINFMKSEQSMLPGLTGLVQLDDKGLRTNIALDIMELSYNGLQRIGTWNSTKKDGLRITRQGLSSSRNDSETLQNKTLIVLTALSEPYGMYRKSVDALTNDTCYEGFGIELIHELSLLLGFNYTFKLQEDSVYGMYNNKTKEWNGMIKELMEENADLAITDLTITSEREEAVDFTHPFMSLGISILYKSATKEPPSLFSFMAPFSTDVWLCIFSVYMGVSFLLWIMESVRMNGTIHIHA
jgi:hypothetical protein